MTNKFCVFLALMGVLITAPLNALAAGPYPSMILQNQFGETSINKLVGGSNQTGCHFTVASTDVGAKGITGLTGDGCAAVYMHTTQNADLALAAGNPNPAVGYIYVKLSQQYAGYAEFVSAEISPLSGSAINIASTGVTSATTYVITSTGGATTSLAGWQSLGLPLGLTPTINQSFIAYSTATAVGLGQVQIPVASGAGTFYVDAVGDPNTMVSATGGAQVILRTLAATSSSVTTLVAKAPVDGTVIKLRFSYTALPSQLH